MSAAERRIWLGSEARELGSGGVRMVADAVQVSPDTVRRGRSELDDPNRCRWAVRGAPAVTLLPNSVTHRCRSTEFTTLA